MKTLRKILDLLSPSEKKNAFFLFFLILLMAILDTLGIASVLPFVAVLSNPKIVETNIILNNFFQISENLGVTNINQFLFFLGTLSFLFLILSLIVKVITTYLQTRFCYMREYTISKRLIEGYLHQPYIWFLKKNSSELGKNILAEVHRVIDESVIPMMNFIAQSAVLLAITTLLFIVEPTVTLIAGLILGISFAIIFYFTKNILKKLGSEHLKENTKRFKIVSEAFGAVKEIKVRGLENFFSHEFKVPAKIYANNASFSSIISLLPRYFVEGVSFGGMIILVLIFLFNGREITNIIPILSLFALAGYRILPSLQQIFFAISHMRFASPHLDVLHKDFTNLSINNNEISNLANIISLNKLINLENICFNYPDSTQLVLKNINLTIPVSSKIGIVGATGSGKTTLVDLIIGLIEPSQGKLSVDENIIGKSNKRLWQKKIGYVPQNIYLSDRSVASNIAFGVDENDINYEALEQAAKNADLHNFIIEELPEQYDTIVGERGVRLSGGQCQRIGIARALYHKPQVLVLDEATSALDNDTEKKIIHCINNLQYDVTIIIIAHRLTTVKKCDTIFVLDGGEIKANGSFEKLKKTNKLFQNLSNDAN